MDANTYSCQSRSQEARNRLVESLVKNEHIVSDKCEDAFRSIPREHFVSRFDIPGYDGTFTHFDANKCCYNTFLDAVYTDNTLLTLYDEQDVATSSSTTPSLMATMLELLDVQPDDRILDVGLGTGYNTALLCYLTRNDRTVSSIDVDPSLVSQGKKILSQLGYHPNLLSGDGRYGSLSHSPYDGIIATCGSSNIPSNWVQQVRPGGSIVANVSFGLIRLDIDDDGVASGRFLQPASFIRMTGNDKTRSCLTYLDILNLEDCTNLPCTQSRMISMSTHTDLGAQFLRNLYLPEISQIVLTTDEGPRCTLYDATSRSWAQATPDSQGEVLVGQKGPRNLWDELLSIMDNWERLGRPPMDRYGLTVFPDGRQLVWLDDVSNVVGSITE